MSISIRIPTPLRAYVGGAREVSIEAGKAGEVLAMLAAKYPDIKKHLYTEDGTLRSFVNVYLGDEDITEWTATTDPRSRCRLRLGGRSIRRVSLRGADRTRFCPRASETCAGNGG